MLVVDDDPDNRAMYAEYFEHAGAIVETAATGGEALAAARAFRPDVVFLDLKLPDMDGSEVALLLKSDPRTASARVIAVTGRGEEHHVRQAHDAGCDEVLLKPVEPRLLAARLAPPRVAHSGRRRKIRQ